MSIWIWIGIGIALIVVFIIWRRNIRAQGTWVDLPSDPHAFVKSEYGPLIDWLAKEAEAQIGRGHNIAGNPIVLSALNEALEKALAERDDESKIEISIPELIHDAGGAHGFRITIDREQLAKFNL